MLTSRIHRNGLTACVLLLTALLCTALQAAQLPDFTATFELKRGSMRIGTSSMSLTTGDDGGYQFESSNSPVRWVSLFMKDKLHESSRGRMDATGVRPNHYHYQRTGGSRERQAELFFDWNAMTVENHVGDDNWKMEIPPATLDKLVSTLGMMLELGKGKTDMTFNIADGGKLKEYRFTVIDRETITTPAGEFDTVKLTKVRSNKKRETYIWCAPALNYLPVRIWQRERDGAEYQSDLETFSESLRVKQ